MSIGHWVTQGAISLTTGTLTTEATATGDITLAMSQFSSKIRVQVNAAFGATPASNLDIYLRPSVTGDTPWASLANLTAVAITGVTSVTRIVVLDALEAPAAQLRLVSTEDTQSITVAASWASWEES